jgi:hypothetical protein
MTSAGAVQVRAPRVNDKRVDPETGQRQRFRSVIACGWMSAPAQRSSTVNSSNDPPNPWRHSATDPQVLIPYWGLAVKRVVRLDRLEWVLDDRGGEGLLVSTLRASVGSCPERTW